jgi:HK97 family phage major capsid protein
MNANAGLLEARTLRLGDSFEKRTRDRLLAEGREAPELAFTFGDMIRAKMIGPQTEAERRAMAATTDTTGGFIVPDILSARVIDKLRPQCAFFQAGAGSVDLTVTGSTLAMGGFITSYARLASDPVAGAHGENIEITPSGATFEAITLSNHSITCLVAPVSMELAVSSPNLGDLLENSISKAMAQELDNQALLGDGAGDRLLGMFKQPLLNKYAVAGGAANGGNISWYTDIAGARQTLLDANAAPPTAAIYSTREDKSRNAAEDNTGQPLQAPPALADLRYYYSQKLPTNLTYGTSTNASQMLLGDFSQVAIGFRLGLQLLQLKERYMSQLAYGWIAVVMCDILLYHEKSFVIVEGITGP